MILTKAKYFACIFLAFLALFCSMVKPVAAKNTSFGMLGFQGSMEPSWPKTPEMIKVAKVDKGSPAEGVLHPGDVIVGIDRERFNADPRWAMANAIDVAETDAAGGRLLLLLASGKQVALTLPVLGTYSATAPYDCPKSEKIIAQTVARLRDDIENPVDNRGRTRTFELSSTKTELLGLMATGDKANIELVGKLIHESDMLDIDPAKVAAFFKGEQVNFGAVTPGWGWGYNLIALGEYYLLTKDTSVLPAMRTYAMGLALGQDAAGLWGHYLARNGRLPGYAQMNQPSLSCFMGLLIAKKCGIDHPVLDKALKKSYAYFFSHVDKGGFPYGVHYPQPSYYNNNGTSGSAAICMSLAGNQHGAAYFSRIAAVAHDSLTSGHASTFFNPFWTPLGAALAGPEVTQQFFRRSLWYFNGRRSLEGGFPGGERAGRYAGQALLMYCLPRRALLITGREADKSIWLDKKAASEIVSLADIDYAGKSTDELIGLFAHPWSQVRFRAVQEIQKKLTGANKARHMAHYNFHVTKTITKEEKLAIETDHPDQTATTFEAVWRIVESGKEAEQISALGFFDNPPNAEDYLAYADKLGAIVRDKNEPFAVRVAAATALASKGFRETNYPYYHDVLSLVFQEPQEGDPFGELDWKLSGALANLCETPFANDLIKDKDLFYKAALRFMDHKRQQVRGGGIRMLADMPLEDFHLVADKLVYVLENKDPTYHSYHNALDTADPGIAVMAHLGIRDGIDYLENLILDGTSKWGFRFKVLNGKLPLFGQEAKEYLVKFEEHPNIKKNKEKWRADMLRWIDQVNATNKLISLEEAVAVGKQRES